MEAGKVEFEFSDVKFTLFVETLSMLQTRSFYYKFLKIFDRQLCFSITVKKKKKQSSNRPNKYSRASLIESEILLLKAAADP